ncbi:hypothetical protein DPMN_149393 [Dreissena polymorpha]|uniref:Uncharacterized protein n=1 Tax=Dreissena polymorpha TaxID=45954 RepID=A0A9D4J596_DREPO|nr:hypothetical protein DPMN_149393 [Dreissena polymorpha]
MGTRSSKEYDQSANVTSEAPDGGWGWVVVIVLQGVVVVGGVFLVYIVIMRLLMCVVGRGESGVRVELSDRGRCEHIRRPLVALLDLHRQGSGPTAWVGSMANAMRLLLGRVEFAVLVPFYGDGGWGTYCGWMVHYGIHAQDRVHVHHIRASDR